MPHKAEASAASCSNSTSHPGSFLDPLHATISLSRLVTILGLGSPVLYLVSSRKEEHTAGLPRARRCGIYPGFSSLFVWLHRQTCSCSLSISFFFSLLIAFHFRFMTVSDGDET